MGYEKAHDWTYDYFNCVLILTVDTFLMYIYLSQMTLMLILQYAENIW